MRLKNLQNYMEMEVEMLQTGKSNVASEPSIFSIQYCNEGIIIALSLSVTTASIA